ncbi:MAG: ATP-binding protein [Haliscomenobacter sp.]
MSYIPRSIEATIRSLLSKYPILALTGPRQSGKTTLLKNLLPNYSYVSLENTDARYFAEADPNGFLAKYHGQTIIDEAQRVPALFSYLQTKVDAEGKMGQYILSGSQNFHLLERITQSLAGRVALCKLLPLDTGELSATGLLSRNWKSSIIQGFYPAIYDRELNPAIFYSNYVQTYLDRDISALSNIHDLRLFRNFLGLCAARTGQLLNMNNLALECGISQPTVKSWLSILESSYILFLLPPYFENFSKRIVKTPKLYFYDIGLASFLLGLREQGELDDDPSLASSLFENLVIADILKKNHHQYLLRDYWFWRDSHGHEIDLLTRRGGRLDISEIKSTQTILPRFLKGMAYFSEIAGSKVRSQTLLYGGDDSHDRTGYAVRQWHEG